MLVPNVNILKNLTFMHSSYWFCASDSHAFSYLNLISQVSIFFFFFFYLYLLLNCLMPKRPCYLLSLVISLLSVQAEPPPWAHYSHIFWVCLWLFETLCISCTASDHYASKALLSMRSKLPLFSSLLAIQISCNISRSFHCVGVKPGCHL